ncbi:unnamed protein product [Pieris macdunnoughi]|uniref:Transposase Helix-turn-helix domain-containing protein n=1 Tax=Pieris macdunnoughi TaxID=345717 RepID=A0A821Y4G3_9NEOP|nr:unnamed protein product [Pieris macdunnoughi]
MYKKYYRFKTLLAHPHMPPAYAAGFAAGLQTALPLNLLPPALPPACRCGCNFRSSVVTFVERNAVSASDRLAITLRYLATGDSYFSLGTLFKVSPQAISLIIPDVCQALVSTLSNYLRMPNTQGEWL